MIPLGKRTSTFGSMWPQNASDQERAVRNPVPHPASAHCSGACATYSYDPAENGSPMPGASHLVIGNRRRGMSAPVAPLPVTPPPAPATNQRVGAYSNERPP